MLRFDNLWSLNTVMSALLPTGASQRWGARGASWADCAACDSTQSPAEAAAGRGGACRPARLQRGVMY